jgi:hypothetical protein
MSLDIDIVRSLAATDKIAFKRHSILRMRQRRITANEVQRALLTGRIIEDYPSDRPLPSGLLLGYTETGRAVHAVVAIDEEEPMLWLITVYEPSLTDWEEGFERRRNP